MPAVRKKKIQGTKSGVWSLPLKTPEPVPSSTTTSGLERRGFLLTADTEGHVGPCLECPHHPGLGGLARRATVMAGLRKQKLEVLLLDAGNFVIGSESMENRGKVIVAAYNALGYDAVNLCHRDFWFGKTETLALLKNATFAVLSANLMDEQKGEPLVRPYVVKEIGGQRIAILGIAQAPAGMDSLPHLKEHLAGIRIQPPVEALAKWLAKAKAESDETILLYYGSAGGLHPIQEKFGDDLAAILVGGMRPEHLPQNAKPPLVGTSNHGRHLAQIRLTGTDRETKLEVTQIAIEPTIEPDAEMEKVLAPFTSSFAAHTRKLSSRAMYHWGKPKSRAGLMTT